MILQAQTVVTMDGPPIADGAVVVDDSGRIVAVGPAWEIGGKPMLDLGASVLLPGLINAHCHLDYTGLRHAIPPQSSFTQWIRCLNALKRKLSADDYLAAIDAGFQELRAWGTTGVCNMLVFPELFSRLGTPPLRTWWFLELIDLHSPVPAEMLAFSKERKLGLNPHAPYTASPELYRLCAQTGLPLTTHLAESAEEEALFRRGEGELADLLREMGRPVRTYGRSSFSNAVRNGLVGPGWLLAHVNEVDEEDLALLAATPGEWHIVHCPRSHAFFRHAPFQWERLAAAGACISLGTDSLASNDSLNLFAEMQAAQKARPHLSSETLLKTVTTHPARALGKAGELGVIRPGARADLIALPYAGPAAQVYDAIVANRNPVPWMMLDGKF